MKRETGITIGICCVFLLIAGFFYLRWDGKGGRSDQGTEQWSVSVNNAQFSALPEGEKSLESRTGEKEETEECTVYICGAVKHPGVYRFFGDSRVCDAVEAAGGLRKKASMEAVNLARPLVDGEQITIPVREKQKGGSQDTIASQDAAAGQTGEANKVNLNEADREELMTLTGIGEAKAQMILDYRQEHGRFSAPEEIMQISGIKEGIYNQIKDKITV